MTLRTDEIIALLEDMCERPLDAEADSTALRAFCREAVRRLELERAEAGMTETADDAEALTALLATVISGRGTDADRAALSAALSREIGRAAGRESGENSGGAGG